MSTIFVDFDNIVTNQSRVQLVPAQIQPAQSRVQHMPQHMPLIADTLIRNSYLLQCFRTGKYTDISIDTSTGQPLPMHELVLSTCINGIDPQSVSQITRAYTYDVVHAVIEAVYINISRGRLPADRLARYECIELMDRLGIRSIIPRVAEATDWKLMFEILTKIHIAEQKSSNSALADHIRVWRGSNRIPIDSANFLAWVREYVRGVIIAGHGNRLRGIIEDFISKDQHLYVAFITFETLETIKAQTPGAPGADKPDACSEFNRRFSQYSKIIRFACSVGWDNGDSYRLSEYLKMLPPELSKEIQLTIQAVRKYKLG